MKTAAASTAALAAALAPRGMASAGRTGGAGHAGSKGLGGGTGDTSSLGGTAAESTVPTLDYRTAFDLAPVGLVLSRRRLMTDCNRELLAMFGATREHIVGRSFEVLYPTPAEFERTGVRIVASLDRRGRYEDERVMRRIDGSLFWCHVSGRALDPKDPHAAGIWAFEDLSSRRVVQVEFTAREREIAALLVEGLTSKLIGRKLTVSPRTVDVYRGRLMRKMGASTTGELVRKLMG